MVAFVLAQNMGRDAGKARAPSQLPGSQGNVSIGAHSLLTIQDFTSVSAPVLVPEALSFLGWDASGPLASCYMKQHPLGWVLFMSPK